MPVVIFSCSLFLSILLLIGIIELFYKVRYIKDRDIMEVIRVVLYSILALFFLLAASSILFVLLDKLIGS